jgi:hypothetical protein
MMMRRFSHVCRWPNGGSLVQHGLTRRPGARARAHVSSSLALDLADLVCAVQGRLRLAPNVRANQWLVGPRARAEPTVSTRAPASRMCVAGQALELDRQRTCFELAKSPRGHRFFLSYFLPHPACSWTMANSSIWWKTLRRWVVYGSQGAACGLARPPVTSRPLVAPPLNPLLNPLLSPLLSPLLALLCRVPCIDLSGGGQVRPPGARRRAHPAPSTARQRPARPAGWVQPAGRHLAPPLTRLVVVEVTTNALDTAAEGMYGLGRAPLSRHSAERAPQRPGATL